MTSLIIEDELAAQLTEIAADENRPLADVLRSLLELYSALPKNSGLLTPSMTANEALAAMDGMFDDDVTDLSTTSWRKILS
ncbi:MAG: hypothetical protein H0X30_30965 [Anaerolineae bacterium]|nr:hypothetical protein [Anaerolineae bacterium]